uniref:Venom allergen 4 n=1 Tax=Odontomachus monticola TaxID=613454 RepID=A0A348G5X7_ODOMO
MKTFVAIVCMLAITTAVYGFDLERVHNFHQNMVKCSVELGEEVIMYRSEIFQCALRNDYRMYDPTMYDTGVHIQKSMLKLIEDCIIKDAEVQWAQGYYRKCYNKYIYNSTATGRQRDERIITCSLSIIFHFEEPKPEDVE